MVVATFAVGAALLLVVVIVSVALHELGHFTFARRYDVPVSRFMIGFGPTLVSRRIGGTTMGLKLLPFGGYVRMKEMYPGLEDPDDAAQQRGRAFHSIRTRQKIAIMAAGPLVNLALAGIILVATFSTLGSGAVAVGTISPCTPAAAGEDCQGGEAPSPAARSLQVGDVLVSIDGEPIRDWGVAVDAIQARPDQPADFEIRRDGELVDVTVDLTSTSADGVEIGYLGMTPVGTLQPQSLIGSIGEAGHLMGATVERFAGLPATAVSTASQMLSGDEVDPDRPVSAIGASQLFGFVAFDPNATFEQKAHSVLILAAQLNFTLFLLNMIPLLPFDGGHIVVAIYQGIRKRVLARHPKARMADVDLDRLAWLTLGVVAALLATSGVFVVADVLAPVI